MELPSKIQILISGSCRLDEGEEGVGQLCVAVVGVDVGVDVDVIVSVDKRHLDFLLGIFFSRKFILCLM